MKSFALIYERHGKLCLNLKCDPFEADFLRQAFADVIPGYHMQEDKYIISCMGLWDMFHNYFWAESPDFIPTKTATAFDAIDIIKRAGGIPVIAHPKSIGKDNAVFLSMKSMEKTQASPFKFSI